MKVVTNINYYNVFQNHKGQYVAIRDVYLAFGNKALEIYYTDNLEGANLFSKTIEKLDADKYYHKFKNVLELELSLLKCIPVTIEKTISHPI